MDLYYKLNACTFTASFFIFILPFSMAKGRGQVSNPWRSARQMPDIDALPTEPWTLSKGHWFYSIARNKQSFKHSYYTLQTSRKDSNRQDFIPQQYEEILSMTNKRRNWYSKYKCNKKYNEIYALFTYSTGVIFLRALMNCSHSN